MMAAPNVPIVLSSKKQVSAIRSELFAYHLIIPSPPEGKSAEPEVGVSPAITRNKSAHAEPIFAYMVSSTGETSIWNAFCELSDLQTGTADESFGNPRLEPRLSL